MFRGAINNFKCVGRRCYYTSKKEKNSNIGTLILFGVPAAITFYLGVWQTRRYFWKIDQIEKRKGKLNSEPTVFNVEMIKDVDEMDSNNYKKIILTGCFDYESEIVVGLRKSPFDKRERTPALAAQNGFYILTPFITDKGVTVIVNRGWVPRSLYQERKKNNITAKRDLKMTTIQAIVRPTETLNDPLAKSALAQDDWYIAMEMKSLSENFGLSNQTNMLCDQIDVDQSSRYQDNSSATFENPQKVQPNDHLDFYVLPITHLGYVATWFGMCAWIVGSGIYTHRKGFKFLKIKK
ncbi:hypothetical protein AKO1_008690 [Acrasis kona]|uniref:SURF1-like protein n=1 Tax=Acrasis kona TaxID=1008807 RepID=A0AAW2ZDC8_9EUKA